MEKETIVDKESWYGLILQYMKKETEPRTAREISTYMLLKHKIGDGTRQAVAPRLTELVGKGFVFEVGKKYDKLTKKYVTTYAGYRMKEGV